MNYFQSENKALFVGLSLSLLAFPSSPPISHSDGVFARCVGKEGDKRRGLCVCAIAYVGERWKGRRAGTLSICFHWEIEVRTFPPPFPSPRGRDGGESGEEKASRAICAEWDLPNKIKQKEKEKYVCPCLLYKTFELCLILTTNIFFG